MVHEYCLTVAMHT